MRRPRWTSELLLVPALAWLGVFFVYPIGRLFYASLFTPAFSLGNYAKLAGSPVYLKVFVNTFEIPATSITARTGPPAIIPVPSGAGFKST